MPTDPKLIDSAAEENIRALANVSFEEIVRLYQADVRVLARRHFASPAEADEVAQEVFVQVYRGLSSFRGESTLPHNTNMPKTANVCQTQSTTPIGVYIGAWLVCSRPHR
ncbi:MAG: RNA polymerase sigma factor, partial [Planctomycetaceae bacterium]